MPDNRYKYGFRFHSTQNGSGRPACFEGIVASGYQANLGTPVGISIGDAVARTNDGTYELAFDTLITGSRFYGVVMGIPNARLDYGKAKPVSYLPGGTTYTREEHTSRILIAPFSDHIWELDSDVLGATLDDYRELMGSNVNLAFYPNTEGIPRANPLLNGPDVVPDLPFRLHNVSDTLENMDFSGRFVKLLIQLNQGSDPMIGVDGVDGL